eukprot:2077084-Ditylum_brightwellii.AAC.1
MKIGLHGKTIIRTGTAGYYKKELINHLRIDNIEEGEHICEVSTIDGVKMVALVHRAKSDHGVKSKQKKENFLSNFCAMDCIITLPGEPAEKKAPPRQIKSTLQIYSFVQIGRN